MSALAPKPEEHRDLLLEVHGSLAEMTSVLQGIRDELGPADTRTKVFDLTQRNPVHTSGQGHNTLAIEIINPYSVPVEIRHGSDAPGGPFIVRVPPQTGLVHNVRADMVSLNAIGVPVGPVPLVFKRYDRTMDPGSYDYAGEPEGGRTRTPLGDETLVVSNVAVGLAAIPPTAGAADIAVTNSAIRAYDDGTVPTAGAGPPFNIGDRIYLDSRAALVNFRAIRQAAPDATLYVLYYDQP